MGRLGVKYFVGYVLRQYSILVLELVGYIQESFPGFFLVYTLALGFTLVDMVLASATRSLRMASVSNCFFLGAIRL